MDYSGGGRYHGVRLPSDPQFHALLFLPGVGERPRQLQRNHIIPGRHHLQSKLVSVSKVSHYTRPHRTIEKVHRNMDGLNEEADNLWIAINRPVDWSTTV